MELLALATTHLSTCDDVVCYFDDQLSDEARERLPAFLSHPVHFPGSLKEVIFGLQRLIP
jgi:hypothetical protein